MLSTILSISILLSGQTEERLHACAMYVENTQTYNQTRDFDSKVEKCMSLNLTVEQIEYITDQAIAQFEYGLEFAGRSK